MLFAHQTLLEKYRLLQVAHQTLDKYIKLFLNCNEILRIVNHSQNEQNKKDILILKLRKGEYQIIKSFLVYYFDVNERKKGKNSNICGTGKNTLVT